MIRASARRRLSLAVVLLFGATFLGMSPARAQEADTVQDEAAIQQLLESVAHGFAQKDVKRIKKVAAELLATLKAEKLKIDNWRAKEATRDAVKVTIRNFLWNDRTGLPASYTEGEVKQKSVAVYAHVFRAYPTAQPAFYGYAEG